MISYKLVLSLTLDAVLQSFTNMEAEASPRILAAISETMLDPGNKLSSKDVKLTREVSANVLERLRTKWPISHKFVVQTVMLPALNAGDLSLSSAALWDGSKDSTFNVQWSSSDLLVVVNVVVIAI